HASFIYYLLLERADDQKDPGSASGVILHSLSMLDFALGYGRFSSLRYINVKFTAPGNGLETSAWSVGTAPDGVREVAFEVKNTITGPEINVVQKKNKELQLLIVICVGHARFEKWE
ncbi:hypothetical protein H4582DRAFT_316770, partial [Lactarius indigo]